MTLDISLDADAEEVSIVLNNQLVLDVHRDSQERIVFGKNFSQIDDDSLTVMLKQFCTKLLTLDE